MKYIQVEHMNNYWMFPIQESRQYIENPSEAPQGTAVKRGPRGAYYYDIKEKPESIADEDEYLIEPKKYEYPKEFGEINREREDNPKTNRMHPQRLTPEQADRYGRCHEEATKKAKEIGGKVYRSVGGQHSVAVKDGKVWDYVLGIEGMSVGEYEYWVPMKFEMVGETKEESKEDFDSIYKNVKNIYSKISNEKDYEIVEGELEKVGPLVKKFDMLRKDEYKKWDKIPSNIKQNLDKHPEAKALYDKLDKIEKMQAELQRNHDSLVHLKFSLFTKATENE